MFGVGMSTKTMRGAFMCCVLVIMFIILNQNYSCAVKTKGDCLPLEDLKLINTYNSYKPMECPAEMTNLTLKTLMFDCYNDLFRQCSTKYSMIIKCYTDPSDSSQRKASCVPRNSTVSPEVPELTAENIETTSLSVLAVSQFNNHSVASYYQLTYNKEGSSKKEVIEVFLKANISNHNNQSSVRFPIENLNSSTVYSMKVKARNNDGYFSVAVTNVTTKDDQHHQGLSTGAIAAVTPGLVILVIVVIVVSLWS